MIQLPESIDKIVLDDESKNYFHMHDDVKSNLIFGNSNIEPDLSIMVPANERLNTLEKTILSLQNLKQPKSLKVQFIIVFNNPNFKLSDLKVELNPEKFLIYVNEKNLGMVGNINRICLLSKGKYVAFCHDDDILLDNYLVEIEKHLPKLERKNFDCVVPNRYFYSNDLGFEKSAKRKRNLGNFAIFSKKILRKVNHIDCAKSWSNCYLGGPTCGVLFKRDSLLSTVGFNENYPYIFDFVFFVNFSIKHNVFLLNKFLSVYRVGEGASSNPKVQVDFFKGNLYILAILKAHIHLSNKRVCAMAYDSYACRNEETRKLIEQEYAFKKPGKFQYKLYRLNVAWNVFYRNLYRYSQVPTSKRGLM